MSAARKALDALETAEITAGRWHPTVNQYATIDEAVAAYRLCLESTPDSPLIVRGVMALEHPETVIGLDPERPELAKMVAIVGNGPAGEANAASIALRHNLSAPLAEIARAAMVLRADRNAYSALVDGYITAHNEVDRRLLRPALDHAQKRLTDANVTFDAALDAFNATAAALGFEAPPASSTESVT